MLGVLSKREAISLFSCLLCSAMQEAHELAPEQHHEGHHKLLERSQLESQSKMFLAVLCPTEVWLVCPWSKLPSVALCLPSCSTAALESMELHGHLTSALLCFHGASKLDL